MKRGEGKEEGAGKKRLGMDEDMNLKACRPLCSNSSV